MGHYITLLDLLADETDLRAAMVEDVVFFGRTELRASFIDLDELDFQGLRRSVLAPLNLSGWVNFLA
jgi:hypothetical protein